jgi:DNA-3-methyladenine glycosylase II
LLAALQSLGKVARFRNPSLWDALATAIIRQVIRAAQAKKLYRAFCDAYGQQVVLPGGRSCATFPTPRAVLDLSAEQFVSIGMAFKRRPLQRAAEAFLSYGEAWTQLSPAVLAKELQAVPGIGAWTAGAAVADWSNDWSLYPYADLAVRTWAKRAAPSLSWPNDEPAFEQMWNALAGDQLSTLTLLTLAWGSQRGDIG